MKTFFIFRAGDGSKVAVPTLSLLGFREDSLGVVHVYCKDDPTPWAASETETLEILMIRWCECMGVSLELPDLQLGIQFPAPAAQ